MILLRSSIVDKEEVLASLRKSFVGHIDLKLVKFVYRPATGVIFGSDEYGRMLNKKECLELFSKSLFNDLRGVFRFYHSEVIYKIGYCVLSLYICYVNE